MSARPTCSRCSLPALPPKREGDPVLCGPCWEQRIVEPVVDAAADDNGSSHPSGESV